MGLRDIGTTLPPGFRFYPSDEELVCHYLHKKILNEDVSKGTLVEIDLHTCEPWQLPEEAKLNATEWYFFSFRDRKYATGFRTNRATTSGYWKATGKDRAVLDPSTREIIGMRKTLVFYGNRAPNGIKSEWIMHEFRLETPHMPPKEDWVLCRVFHKGKEENSAKMNPQFMFETAASAPFNLTASPVPDQTLHGGHHQPVSSLSSTPTYQNLQVDQSSFLNLLQVSKGRNGGNLISDDEYGFLWEDDMNMEETCRMGDGMGSNFEDNMRYEVDNSMVFL